MTDRLHLPQRYRRILEALLHEYVPDAEVWAYGSRVTGESHDGSDLDLVVRGPELKPLGHGFFDLLEAIEKSNIPILVQAHDWARLPESFHEEIEREYIILQERGIRTRQDEWREVTLGDVLTLQRGFDLPKSKRIPGPYPVIASTGPIGTHYAAAVQGPGVAIGRSGSIGGGQFIRSDFWPLNTTLWVKDFRGNDKRFCYYFLKSLDLARFNAGSGVPTLNRNHIHPLAVKIPSVTTQHTIGRVLGALDDKIELNRRMNDTLEEMARALFKSWFVDFLPVRAKQRARTHTGDPVRAKAALRTTSQGGSDWSVERARAYLDSMDKSVVDLFPDRLVDSELGEIPEGWEVGKLGDIVTRLTNNENPGLSPNTEFSHFSIPAYDEGQLPKRELGKEIKSSKSRVPQNVVLLSKLNPEIERVWLADALPTEKAICSTEFLVLRARPPFTRSYVYCIARLPLFREQMKSLVTGTSKSHQRAPANAVLSIDTVLPSQEIAEAFELSASRVLRRVLDNRKESRTLATLRDALLPKLVSGEMRICEGHKNRTREK